MKSLERMERRRGEMRSCKVQSLYCQVILCCMLADWPNCGNIDCPHLCCLPLHDMRVFICCSSEYMPVYIDGALPVIIVYSIVNGGDISFLSDVYWTECLDMSWCVLTTNCTLMLDAVLLGMAKCVAGETD